MSHLRLISNNMPEPKQRASDRCPSLFEFERLHPNRVDWKELAPELRELRVRGVIVRDSTSPSGHKPTPPSFAQNVRAARLGLLRSVK